VKLPPKPDQGIPVVSVPRPGVFVGINDDNTKPLHVYADRAGVRYVKIDDRDRALVWRAYVGTEKKFKRYDNSRFAPLDPLIGKGKVAGKLANKVANAAQGVGNFFVGKWARTGNELAQILTEDRVLFSGEQAAARAVVEDTADALIARVLADPRNAKIAKEWRPGRTGQETPSFSALRGAVYMPSPED
jgi:hypothetical protein